MQAVAPHRSQTHEEHEVDVLRRLSMKEWYYVVVGARHLVEWLEGTGDRFCGSLPRSIRAGRD